MDIRGNVLSPKLGVTMARPALRWVATVGTAAIFLATYPILVQLLGDSGANTFVLAPIVVAAWHFGLKGGLIGGISLVEVTGTYSWVTAGDRLPPGVAEHVVAAVAVGAVVGWLSDLRRTARPSELMYASLVENGPAMTYVWSRKVGVRFISSNAEAVTGYSKREWESDYTGWAERHLEPPDQEAMAMAFEALRLYGRPIRATLRVRRRDGSLIWVDHNADCIERSGDDITIQGTVIDVTARHEVAEAQEISKAARAESESKSMFLAAMSHELRTPLNSVLGFAQLLEADLGIKVDERQARYVANIQSSGQHLLAVINDILDLSKVAAGRVEMSYEEVDAFGAVREAVAKMMPLCEQKGLTLRVKPVAESLVLRADRLRLNQILLNLLSNAVKFTDIGSIKVTCEAENGVAAIRVSDSGAGIAAKSLNLVFDEFTQVGSPRQSQGGTGLGLPLSRRLAQAMGGDVTVGSRLGRGSTFTLSLPLAGH